jgi:hypothetical protein
MCLIPRHPQGDRMKKIEAYLSISGNIHRTQSEALMEDLREETKTTIKQISTEVGNCSAGIIENFFHTVALSYARDGETYTLRPFSPKKFLRQIQRLRDIFWDAKAQYDMEIAQAKAIDAQKQDEHSDQ